MVTLDTALALALAAQYPSMLSLDLRNNSIVALQDLSPLSRLRELSLDGNHLTELGPGLSGMRYLTALSARSNAITRLGGDVAGLDNLGVLDLADNQLAAGPWLASLARLPRLTDLDLHGNPVCRLEGSRQLLGAALPGLHRLNGQDLQGPGPAGTLERGPQEDGQRNPGGAPSGDQGRGRLWEPSWAPGPGAAPGGEEPVQYNTPYAEDSLEYGTARPQLPLEPQRPYYPPPGEPAWGDAPPDAQRTRQLPRQRQQQQQGPQEHEREWQRQRQPSGPEGPGEAVAEELRRLAADRGTAVRQAAELEEALRRAEEANAQLRQQLQQQQQQAAGAADRLTAAAADRDAASRRAEALASQLADARASAAEEARAAEALRQQAEALRGSERRLQQELAATQGLLLEAQSSASSSAAQLAAAAAATGAAGAGAGAGAVEAATDAGGGGGGGGGGAQLVRALQLRVEALQHIVRMQEQELSQLHTAESQLRSARRERAALLALLRQHNLQPQLNQRPDQQRHMRPDDEGGAEGAEGATSGDGGRDDDGAADVLLPLPPGGRQQERQQHQDQQQQQQQWQGGQHLGQQQVVQQQQEQQRKAGAWWAGAAAAAGGGNSISSIIWRAPPIPARTAAAVFYEADTSALRDSYGAPRESYGTPGELYGAFKARPMSEPAGADWQAPRGPPQPSPALGAGRPDASAGDVDAARSWQRLGELEALTRELLEA
ncbi:Geranylgeranyl transferase type-2 subunit alpha [Tetrabaena socialis]|uniref:Geranylgeranyl transferase type-2 subunit alpha n=1 Tax=Tetrabaena socialis TaxID=47790 RepID=A0A2J8ADQ2_9CHLO|nr:Geranylgeranyl transferase type-2 subunit alpha [Tetrabaena socialis]|eukprot:PNH10650.1 Geranylgeranyl transferase type-2 subunit alpha [Tetrabaena socialis]